LSSEESAGAKVAILFNYAENNPGDITKLPLSGVI